MNLITLRFAGTNSVFPRFETLPLKLQIKFNFL